MDVMPINVNFCFSPYSFLSTHKAEIVDTVCLWFCSEEKSSSVRTVVNGSQSNDHWITCLEIPANGPGKREFRKITKKGTGCNVMIYPSMKQP